MFSIDLRNVFLTVSTLALTGMAALAPAHADDTIREYSCPPLIEFKFAADFTERCAYVFSGGNPVLRLDHAEVDGDQLVCQYERSFDIPENSANQYFAFLCESSATCFCWSTLWMYAHSSYDHGEAGWEFSNPYGVKAEVPAVYSTPQEAWFSMLADEDSAYQYDSCIYSRALVDDVDPNLYREKDGVCITTQDDTAFRCADSIHDLYDISYSLNVGGR